MNHDDDPEALALIDVAMAPGTRLAEETLTSLNAHGDLSAPPGSRPWAIAVRRELQSAIHDRESDTMNLKRFLLLMEEHEGYKALTDARGKTFRSYRAFCEARHPIGLGYDPEMLQLVIAERKTAEQRATVASPQSPPGGDRKSEQFQAYNVSLKHGNNPEYLTARIARDRPDILERMKAGEYKSVRAAAIDAGIVKVPTTLEKLNRTWEMASPEERAAFWTRIRAEAQS
jgi:hypothetical protein